MASERSKVVNSDRSCEEMVEEVRRLYREHHYVTFSWTEGRKRSDQQRKAIEVFCRELARELNDAGMDQRKVLAEMREGVELPWSQERVKEVLWREVQVAVTGKKSTTTLERDEVSKVYDILNRWTADKLGVSVEFPHIERVDT